MSRATKLAALLLGAALAVGTLATAADAEPSPSGPDGPASPSDSPSPSRSSTASPSPSPSPTPRPSPAVISPAVTPGQLTVTIAKNCDSYSIEATVENGTASPVTVGVANGSGPVFQTVTVGAGETGVLAVRARFSDSYDLVYRRLDTGEEVGSFQEELFTCPRRIDYSIRVVSGSSTSGEICPVVLFLGARRPQHGTLRIAETTYTYTPDAGYVGPDRFDYQCLASAEQFGTVHITVLPAPPGHPAPPTLPATGATGVRAELAAGVGLLLAGLLVVWLARRRRNSA